MVKIIHRHWLLIYQHRNIERGVVCDRMKDHDLYFISFAFLDQTLESTGSKLILGCYLS